MRDKIPYINIHTHQKCENELSIVTKGVHPYDAQSGICLTKKSIGQDVDAIGEIGLDFSRSIDKLQQEKLFRQQLSLAQELNLAVVIHSVRSLDRTLQILRDYTLKAVIFHGFIGSKQQARVALQRGYFLSFGHRSFVSPKTLEVLRSAPLSNIFFETDQCDISIEEIYSKGAQYRDESLEEIKERLNTNYINIFRRQ
ncbi:MAG: TatD family hydrolase [Rikenellaceae bacterium]